MKPMQETSSSLVRGLTDFKDHQKWFEFEQTYRPLIRKLLHDKGFRGAELDDVVQETYLSLLSTVEQFRYDRSKGMFRSWLSKITERAASAHRRRRKAPAALDPADLGTQPVDDNAFPDPADASLQLCLQLARSRFDEHTWLPFYLRVVEEVPIEEVVQITGMNRNAVYQCIHRVKLCIRQMLAHLEGER